MTKILVVGCGVTGSSFVTAFINKSKKLDIDNIDIDIINKDDNFAKGLAYGKNASPFHRINMRALTMSVKPFKEKHFYKQLAKNQDSKINIIDDNYFYSRLTFGEYSSTYYLKKLSKIQQRENIRCNNIIDEIIDIKDNGYKIEAVNKEQNITQYDIAVICIGNQPATSYQYLIGKKGYIHDAWNEGLNNIPANEPVVILGSGLTSIDFYLTLKENKHQGKIYFVSNHGFLPKVRPLHILHNLKFLTKEYLEEQIKTNKDKLSLEQIMQLFYKEFETENIKFDINTVLQDLYSKSTQEILQQDIAYSQKQSTSFSILKAIDENISIIWNSMTIKAQQEFDKKFKTLWSIYDYPMPQINAQILLEAIRNGNLEIIKGLESVVYTEEEKLFKINFCSENQSTLKISHVINATGNGINVNNIQNQFLQNTLASKTLISHPLGGIDVDFETGRVKTKAGLSSNIFFAGSLTRGVHFYTNSAVENAKASARIADYIIKTLTQ